MDHHEYSQRISRDRREQGEQRRPCQGMDMSTYQVDTQFKNCMVRCTDNEMKLQESQDDDKEKVSIKYEMDKQPNRGKSKRDDDDEDDQKPAVKPKKNVTKDDYYTEESEEQNNEENEQEIIKKKFIREMFVKHFKSTLGPQDDEKEPHPCIAHMYAIHITGTMNVLQAMVMHQRQLLDLYHPMTCQDPTYKSFAERQWSK